MAKQATPTDPALQLEIDLWLRQAARQREAGQVGPAVKLYQRVLARAPGNQSALLGMSDAALETGATDVAEGLAARAAALSPRAGAPILALARVRLAQRRPDDAIAL